VSNKTLTFSYDGFLDGDNVDEMHDSRANVIEPSDAGKQCFTVTYPSLPVPLNWVMFKNVIIIRPRFRIRLRMLKVRRELKWTISAAHRSLFKTGPSRSTTSESAAIYRIAEWRIKVVCMLRFPNPNKRHVMPLHPNDSGITQS